MPKATGTAGRNPLPVRRRCTDDARTILYDPGYREIAPLRQDNTRSNLVIFGGYDE